ncbi:MAG: T9SS type A sorting domain-containing protein [Ignavibacteria bacterium]|nr:T9SS type A sorting domain-containing protein [Ignavibacteria bacterium]
MRKIIFITILIALTSGIIYSFGNGIAGRTLKNTTSGCASCHNFNTSTTGVITGPDTITVGQTVEFTISFSGINTGLYGVDIAAKYGSLSPGAGSNYLKLLDGELVQISGIQSSVPIPFNYTAPLNAGSDTLYAVVDKGYPGRWNWVPNKGIVVKPSVGIKENNTIPDLFYLKQNYPNPFNNQTRISFSIPYSSHVVLNIYDLQGVVIDRLLNANLKDGEYDIIWDSKNFPSGLYFYRIFMNNYSITKKMVLIK